MRPRPRACSSETIAVAAPSASARVTKVVAVEVLALDGEEGVAGRDACGCRWRCPRWRPGAAPTGRPPVAATRSAKVQSGALMRPPRRRACRGRRAWSENGITSEPTIWPVSWPLPATQRTSPGPSIAIARRIASPRSPISIASGAPVEDRLADRRRILRARVVVGDDDDVGMLGSGASHQRPLAGVAVAAGAEDDDEAARASSAGAPQARSRWRRACGRSR